VFFERPDEMFGVDRFHPSALGYRRTAEALLSVVVDAVHIPERTSVPDSRPGGETSRASPDTP
jgi:hypothetical protein